MTKATDATMRRIAIVLASLPESVAQKLLGSLPRENQRLVRSALGTLSEVDPLEQRRALDGFASSLRKDKALPQKASDAAEIVFSRAAIRNLNERADDRGTGDSLQRTAGHEETSPHSATPLGFLLDVDDESLVAHLKGEMPQTLAIILASISPSQAARVLPRLDPAVRADAMRRIANLKELPADLIDDIGSQLRDRFSTSVSNGTGRRALEAILAEMPQAPPAVMTKAPAMQPLTSADQRRSESSNAVNHSSSTASSVAHAPMQFTEMSRAEVSRAEVSRAEVSRAETPRSERPSFVGSGNPKSEPTSSTPPRPLQAPPLKVAEGTWPEGHASAQSSANRPGSAAPTPLRAASPLDSTDAIHDYLISLPVDRLRETLGRGETRQALLTLCGLPNSKAEAVLASLPRRQAKQVRDQLASLGTLQLRDIDEAKAAIAALAYDSVRDRPVSSIAASASFDPSKASRLPASSPTAAAA